MAVPPRHNTQTVEKEFEENPSSFDFHTAVQLLESDGTSSRCFGENIDPKQDKVRVKSNITLGFPSSEVEDIDLSTDKPTIHLNLVSMGGRQGPLPTHITETIIERARLKDTGFKDFLDIFNQRLAGLWYRFRRKYLIGFIKKIPEQTDLGRSIENMGGLTQEGLDKNVHLPIRLTLAAHRVLWPKQRSKAGLQTLLFSYWKVPIEIEEFQGDWVQAPESEITKLGNSLGQHQILGSQVILGKHVWDQTRAITVSFGPVGWENFNRFICKTQKGIQTLKDMIFFYIGMRFKVRLRIKLEPKEIHFLRIDNSFYLGQNTWLFCDNKETLSPSYGIELARPAP
jgi:type VI secretion system protein ImpH